MGAPLDDDAELAAALGRMVGAWSHLEYRLTVLFAMLTEMDLNMAAAVFDFFKSTSTQIDVMRRVSRLSPRATDKSRASLGTALKTYQRLAPLRNALAHNPFGWDDPEQTDVYIMEKTKGVPGFDGLPYRKRQITVEKVNDLRAEIDVLSLVFALELQLMPPPTSVRTPVLPPPDSHRLGVLSNPSQSLPQEPAPRPESSGE